MVIILDDVVNLNSSFQRDIINVFSERKQKNIDERWYSLDEEHMFKDFCVQMITKANYYVNLTSCIGYEFWTQNNTRPARRHQDKDERLVERTGEYSFPLCSLIYYPIVENLEGGQLHVDDAIITPKTNRLVIMSPGMWHYVEKFTGTRISFLINPWDKTLNKIT